MRPLNRNEQLLALALGGTVFLLLNLFGMRWVAGQMRSGRAEIAQLESDVAAARQLLKQKPFWVARQDWLLAHQPELYDARTSRSKFVEEVQASVTTSKLQIASQQPQADEQQGMLATTWIDLTVTGRLEAIVSWIHALQQPGKYAVVKSFTLKQADEGNTMELHVLLGKIFRSGELTAR
jgi:Tfp pilus assembly protein PilO